MCALKCVCVTCCLFGYRDSILEVLWKAAGGDGSMIVGVHPTPPPCVLEGGKLRVWGDGSAVESITAVAEGVSSVSSTSVRWLTAASNSRGSDVLFPPPQPSALTCTYPSPKLKLKQVFKEMVGLWYMYFATIRKNNLTSERKILLI